MFKYFAKWTKVMLLIGMLASTLVGTPAQAGALLAAPKKPVLQEPRKGSLTQNTTPYLRWKDNGADHYVVQIAYDKGFTQLFLENTVTEVNYGPGVLSGTRFYWRVKAVSAGGDESAWSAVWNFKSPLLKPELVSPAHNEELPVDRPTLTWDTTFNAAQYNLQVSAVETFKSLLLNVTIPATVTEYTLIKDLPQDKILYWRVRAKNPLSTGPWSVKWIFKTGNPPTVPVFTAPKKNSLVKVYTPLLDWKDAAVPNGTTLKHYEIEVDDNQDFSSPVSDTSPSSDFTPGSDLASNTTFYWRVRAVNDVNSAEHVSGWSTPWAFRTVIAPPASLTMVSGGPNPLRPLLEWDDATGPFKNYTIQIAANSNFKPLIANASTPNSHYQLPKNLPSGQTIYWRVRVNGPNGPSDWSTSDFVSE